MNRGASGPSRFPAAVLVLAALALLLAILQRSHRPRLADSPAAATVVAPTNGIPPVARPVGVAAGVSSPASVASTPAAEEARTGVTTNWVEALLDRNGEIPPLPAEVVQGWLASGHTNAADLLALKQAGCGTEYLRMALTNHPADPRVLFAALALEDGPPARRERLDLLQTAAPENSLADYLSARDHLQNGRKEQALADLAAAATKPRFDDYVLDAMLTTEELYLQAGKSPAEAKALGTSTALLPHLAQLKGLANGLAGMQGEYLAAGDAESAEALARLGVQLGERLTRGEGSGTLIGELVGMSIERIVLKQLDAAGTYEFLAGSVADRLAELDARKDAIRGETQRFEGWLRTAGEPEIASYFDRFKVYGETEALRWLAQRLGAP